MGHIKRNEISYNKSTVISSPPSRCGCDIYFLNTTYWLTSRVLLVNISFEWTMITSNWFRYADRKRRWPGALMISLIYACTQRWANNRDAGDLRRHRPRYDVTVMNPGVDCSLQTIEQYSTNIDFVDTSIQIFHKTISVVYNEVGNSCSVILLLWFGETGVSLQIFIHPLLQPVPHALSTPQLYKLR